MSRYFAIILFFLFSGIVKAQVNIGGDTLNSFYRVNTVNMAGVICNPGDDLSDLNPGDKVVLWQVTGTDFQAVPAFNVLTGGNYAPNFGGAGLYEMLSVQTVNNGSKEVTFTANLNNFGSYDASEKIQLIKIFETENAVVTSTLTAPVWDSVNGTGGVLAMVILDELTLNANIDLSNKGFKGGAGITYLADCRPNVANDTSYFTEGEVNKGGRKGEGLMMQSFNYTIGDGNSSIGGGGGPGKFGGGAGGGNFKKGGTGGTQYNACVLVFDLIGRGGEGYGALGFNDLYNRVSFGGGGGGSTYDVSSAATSGGNGGGLIILLANTLNANGFSINTTGQSVNATSITGAGGGGAGGSILLDVETYTGALNVDISGGNGGSVDANCGGGGGGGAGGLLWHNMPSPPAGMTIDSTGGLAGVSPGTCINVVQTDGDFGRELSDFVPELNGFNFNSVTKNDTLCTGQTPNQLIGTTPKGAGSPSYQWQSSSSFGGPYSNISGATSKNYQPPVLTTTTYYRREVVMGAITDYSTPVEILVYSDIANNILTLRDTVCSGTAPGELSANAVSGGAGAGSYSYIWESSPDGSAPWDNRGAAEFLDEDQQLTADRHYRRIVFSGPQDVCKDTSANDHITTLTPITNNIILNTPVDSGICINQPGGSILADNPGGGDNIYRYQWQASTNGTDYTDIGGAISKNYNPGILSASGMNYYRRIVQSGEGNACKDTMSTPRTIQVVPAISNNLTLGAVTQYTCFNTSKSINGSDPENGFGAGTYSYNWQFSDDGNNWMNTGKTSKDLASDPISDSTYFRRLVISGENAQCNDTSNTILTRINALPTGDVINGYDTICEGDEITIRYENLTGPTPWTMQIGESAVLHTEENITEATGSFTFNLNEPANLRVLTLEDDSSCFADTSINSGVVQMLAYAVPIADAGQDFEACGLQATLAATLSTPGTGTWTSSEGTFDNDTLPNAKVTMESYNSKILTWTERNWTCVDDDEVEIIFYEQPAEISAGEDQELAYTFFTVLEGNEPFVPSSGFWTFIEGTGTFDDSTVHNTTVNFDNLGNQTLEWTIINGVCDPISDQVLFVVNDLVLNNGFSPNGDEINDIYTLEFPSGNSVKMTILDRNGNVVRILEVSEEIIEWDGTNESGNQVPEDTYFFIIEEEGWPARNGFIELRR